jgi:hypothetical protein
MRRITDPNREEIMEGCRKLYNELYNLCSSPNISRVVNSKKMRWVGHVAWVRDEEMHTKSLFGKPEGKRLLGRLWHKWEDVRVDLVETGWEGVDWMHLAQDRDQKLLL